MAAKVCVLEHAVPETPGIIADVLVAKAIGLEHVRPYRGEPVPDRMDEFAGLLVMGGPMGVYEADRFPFLRDELSLIERALAEEKPILGICLGSQLLAAALGAAVVPGHQEIGWFEVTLGRKAEADPLWSGIGPRFTAFHWHGDRFDLPRGASPLASSDSTPHQAFRHGLNAYGILFHMEVTEPMVGAMVRTFPDGPAVAGADAGAILTRAPAVVPTMHRIARTVFDRWADLLARQSA